jgi:Protein of unknown function (DUF3604)
MRFAGLTLLLVLALAPAALAQERWYAGDGHVHTCYSHDAFCIGKNENYDTFYSAEGTVEQRFGEGAAKGLDFLVISDHNNVDAQTDPAYGSAGVAGLPAYEASLRGGHAQMLGAAQVYPTGDGEAPATRALADALRADGGKFQANHPSYKAERAFTECAQAEQDWEANPLDWKYGYSVRPDSIEVWNATSLIQPAELYWECWLQRGVRVGATAGSDSHGANQPTIANPTTWVLARSRQPRDLLDAIGAGRTTLSRLAPNQGGTRLLLEGDGDGDGVYEAGIGEQVPAGAALRVRGDGMPGPGLVRVRANGSTLVDAQPLAPGGEVKFKAPEEAGWVRAVLYLEEGTRAVDPLCSPVEGSPEQPPLDFCSADLAIAAMTSPIYVGPRRPPAPDSQGTPSQGYDFDREDEPDDDGPLPAREQSGGASPLPDVPSQRPRGERLRFLRARVDGSRSGRRPRVRLSWPSDQVPVQVQIRRGGRWRTVRPRTRAARLTVHPRFRRAYRFRARMRPEGGTPGPWRSLRVRYSRR